MQYYSAPCPFLASGYNYMHNYTILSLQICVCIVHNYTVVANVSKKVKFNVKLFFGLILFSCCTDYDPRVGPGMSIVAKFEMGGVRGSVCFTQDHPSDPVTITVKLDGLEQFAPEMYPWGVYQYPVKFGNYPDFPCSDLGSFFEPNISCPANVTCAYGNFTGKHGPLQSTNMAQVFGDSLITLFGPNSLVGRSVCIQRENGLPFICANIEYQGISLQAMRAAFGGIGNSSSNLTGDVIFRRANGRSGTTLNVCLNTNCGYSPPATAIDWSIRTGTCDNPGPVSIHTCKYIYIYIP